MSLRTWLGFWFPWEETYSEFVSSRQYRPFLFDGGDLPDRDIRRTTKDQDDAREAAVAAVAGQIPDVDELRRLDLADLVAVQEQVLRFVHELPAPRDAGAPFARGFWTHSLLMERVLDGRDARNAIEVALAADDDRLLLALLDLETGDDVDEDFVAGFAAGNQAVAAFVHDVLARR